MRLNWFVPSTHRKRIGLPARLAPGWAGSPVRRLTQSIALALFLALFLTACRFSPDTSAFRRWLPAELFLWLDPLGGVSAAIASRTWAISLIGAGAILGVCLAVPRGFCGYLCPLGTLIDLFDWAIGARTRKLHLPMRGWWTSIRYAVLAGVLVAAIFGVMLSGFVAAIPVLTRATQFVVSPMIPATPRPAAPIALGQGISIGLFACVLLLGLVGRRFWCRCLCPTGALFSLFTALRLTRRKVRSSCVECGKCLSACSFGAIRADFSTRNPDCTFCQDCGSVCPVGAIEFVSRGDQADERPSPRRDPRETSKLRRGLLAGLAGGVLGGIGLRLLRRGRTTPVRPPGSLPEERFLGACVRCGSCVEACPTGILVPAGTSGGVEGLWAPVADATRAGCDPTCNRCGHVCPTGAIQALTLAEKRATRMGLALVNTQTCLPHANRGECGLCVRACEQAGYRAIEYTLVHPELDEMGMPVEDSGFLAPSVRTDRCVGCGNCQATCQSANVRGGLLTAPAIVVHPLSPGQAR
jgi:ferredoxin